MQSVLDSRVVTQNTLEKYFIREQIRYDWLEENVIGELYLDTETGEFSLEIIDCEDLDYRYSLLSSGFNYEH